MPRQLFEFLTEHCAVGMLDGSAINKWLFSRRSPVAASSIIPIICKGARSGALMKSKLAPIATKARDPRKSCANIVPPIDSSFVIK